MTGLSAHYALTSALGHAPASIVAPMEFVRLPLIALVGALLYGEELKASVFVGAALIIAGNLVEPARGDTTRPGLTIPPFVASANMLGDPWSCTGGEAMTISKIEPGVNPPES